MNVLDENIIGSQREMLRGWHISVRQIGHDLGQQGIKDEQIIPFLCQLRQPTFFTRDLGFYQGHLCHARYCLVCLAVERYEVATFVRRLLKHPEFNTQAKRMGAVIRVSQRGIAVWRPHVERVARIEWTKERIR